VQVGPGVQDYGNIGFAVWTGGHAVDEKTVTDKGEYRSRFTHDDEVATPGLYSAVLIDADNATVEVVPCAGPQSVSYEISWPTPLEHLGPLGSPEPHGRGPGRTRAFLFDLAASLPVGSVIASGVNITVAAPAVLISGYAQNNGPLTGRNQKGGTLFYFSASIGVASKDVAAFGVWTMNPNSTTEFHRYPPASFTAHANGTSVGAFVELPPMASADTESAVRVTVALSMISVAQAEVNRAEQIGTRSHVECTSFARDEWSAALGRFQLTTTPKTQDWRAELVKFYTAVCVPPSRPVLAPQTSDTLTPCTHTHTRTHAAYRCVSFCQTVS
jgi:hypothetical protein